MNITFHAVGFLLQLVGAFGATVGAVNTALREEWIGCALFIILGLVLILLGRHLQRRVKREECGSSENTNAGDRFATFVFHVFITVPVVIGLVITWIAYF